MRFEHEGEYDHRIDWTPEKKDRVVELIDKFVTSVPSRYGESAFQNDDCLIRSVDLFAAILDVIKPYDPSESDEEDEDEESSDYKSIGTSVFNTGNGWVVSQGSTWLPGVYDSDKAAFAAADRLSVDEIYELNISHVGVDQPYQNISYDDVLEVIDNRQIKQPKVVALNVGDCWNLFIDDKHQPGSYKSDVAAIYAANLNYNWLYEIHASRYNDKGYDLITEDVVVHWVKLLKGIDLQAI